MSQYGAEGAARAGWSAARILAWFYRGTHLGRVDNVPIGVELAAGASSIAVAVRGEAGVIVEGTGRRDVVRPGVRWLVRAGRSGELIMDAAGRPARAIVAPTLRIVPGPGGVVVVAGRPYRGSLSVTGADGMRVVNVLPIEQYLRGVVTSEMPASWHPAAQILRHGATRPARAALAGGSTSTPIPAVRSTGASRPSRRPATAPWHRVPVRS